MLQASVTQEKNSKKSNQAQGSLIAGSAPFVFVGSGACSCQSHLPEIPCCLPVPSFPSFPCTATKVHDDEQRNIAPRLAIAGRSARGKKAKSKGPFTCLDLIETSEQIGKARRVGWGALRRDSLRVVSVLHSLADEAGRAVRMESCSRDWMAYRHVPTRGIVLRSNRCRDRFCLVCMSLRSSAMVRRFDHILKTWPLVRMMSFTVRSQSSLRDQIAFLRASFRELRRRRAWKTHVTGYLVTMEVTHSVAGWHAHLHVLADGSYWPFEELKKAWKEVTKDEGSVDIRRAGSVKEALKYVVKPKNLMGMDEVVMTELIETLKGVRTLSTGGSLRGLVTEEELDSDDEMGLREEYEPIGRLDGIVERYRAGDRSADVVDTVKLALKLGILERVEQSGGRHDYA